MRIPRRNATVSQVVIATLSSQIRLQTVSNALRVQVAVLSMAIPVFGYAFFYFTEKKIYPNTGDSPDNYKNE